ncbi:phosphate uptake regulator PhoU [Candidatus Woesearchaeota archaeon]|nr:phosphate uptake regulator PhoU [Candidatus Woesearchaeota archaeon]
MEKFRKIIKFGTSSYVLSLPSEWTKKNKLGKGDLISISENINNELVLSIPSKEKSMQKREVVIHVGNKDLTRIKRELISAYINNYGIIRIQGKISSDYVEEIRSILKGLTALELVEQTSDSLVTKDFLDISEITFQEILRKMDTITRSMMLDLKNIAKENISKSIIARDVEVNRMTYLIIRTMRFTLESPSLSHKENRVSMANILNVWDVALNIEGIADDLKRTSREVSRMKTSPDFLKELLKVFEEIEKFYLETMKSYYAHDTELAFCLSLTKSRLSQRCNELHETVWNVKYAPIILENFKSIISSIHNLGRRVYS